MLLKLLLIRNNIYYFRWQFPASIRHVLGKRELIRSLATNSLSVALTRAQPLYTLVTAFRDVVRDFKMKKLTDQNYKEILRLLWEMQTKTPPEYSGELRSRLRVPSREEFSATLAQNGGPFFPGMLEVDKQIHEGGYQDGDEGSEPPQAEEVFNTIDDMDFIRRHIDDRLQYLKKATFTRHGGYADEEVGLYDFNRAGAAYDLLRLGIGDCTQAAFERLLKDYVHFEIEKYERLLTKTEELHYTTPTHIREAFSSNTNTQNPIAPAKDWLSVLWAEFKEDKIQSRNWSNASDIAERDAEFKDFLELIGGDMPCRNVTLDIAKQYRAGLISFPKNRRKIHKNLSLSQIPESAEKISDSTAYQRLQNTKSFFNFIVNSEYLESSPFQRLTIAVKPKSYATYTKKDLRELFNLDPKYVKTSWQFWIPRIALYSGARQDEIAQLSIDDVRQDDETGIWYFRVNAENGKSVKTPAAIRRVPLHSQLIQHGFLEYHSKLCSKPHKDRTLWPGLKAKAGKRGQTVSRYWTKLKTEHNTPSEPKNDSGEEKVFHSLRRNAISKLMAAEVLTETVQRLVGHEPSLGTTRVYVDDINKPLSTLKAALEQLKFEDIGWNQPHK